jgi:hypothetical protein
MTRLIVPVLALSLAGCTVGESGHLPTNDEPVVDLSTALLVHSRDRLQLCLQIDPLLADQSASLVARLSEDVALLRAAHPDWQASGLDHGAVSIEIGCPGAAVVERAIDPKGAGGEVLGPGYMATPSPYRTHVHVIADSRAASVLGDRPFARALAELAQVDEHRVAEVSTALVVPASALGTEAFRMQALAESVGLQAR